MAFATNMKLPPEVDRIHRMWYTAAPSSSYPQLDGLTQLTNRELAKRVPSAGSECVDRFRGQESPRRAMVVSVVRALNFGEHVGPRLIAGVVRIVMRQLALEGASGALLQSIAALSFRIPHTLSHAIVPGPCVICLWAAPNSFSSRNIHRLS
jgi:hypothetical protein